MHTSDSFEDSPRLQGIEVFLATHRRWVCGGLLALAMVIRLIYALEIRHSPIPELWRGSQTDMSFYVAWATVVANGDWLTNRELHPYFGWQVPIGTQAEWIAWYGGKTFHQSPLYPYLMGVLFRALGQSLWVVYALQVVLSGGTVLLIWLITCRLLDDTAGLIAGVLAAAYGTLVFYDFVALRDSSAVFSSALTVALALWAERRGGLWRWLLVGLSIGIGTLLRANAAVLLVLIMMVMVWGLWRQWGRLFGVWACIIGGCVAGLMPLVVRNVCVGVSPLAIEAVGPSTFYLSNGAGAPGSGYGILPGFPEAMRRTQGRFLPLVREAFRTHESIGSVTDLFVRKLTAVMHFYERNNNANRYYAERFSAILRWGTVPFGLVLALAIAGGYVCRSNRHALIWLGVAVLAPLLTILLFYQTDRFRLPMIVGLIPLAAGAVESLLNRRDNALAVLMILVVAGVVIFWPDSDDPPGIEPRDFSSGAAAMSLTGRHESAIAEAREATRRFPREPLGWVTLVRCLYTAGRTEEAVEAWRQGMNATDQHPGLERLGASLMQATTGATGSSRAR